MGRDGGFRLEACQFRAAEKFCIPRWIEWQGLAGKRRAAGMGLQAHRAVEIVAPVFCFVLQRAEARHSKEQDGGHAAGQPEAVARSHALLIRLGPRPGKPGGAGSPT